MVPAADGPRVIGGSPPSGAAVSALEGMWPVARCAFGNRFDESHTISGCYA
jgi:hypothetical protein